MLKVKRGTTYAFKVAAGSTHPLYLTSSEVGGGSYNDFANETVYAGGDDSLGTCQLDGRLQCLLCRALAAVLPSQAGQPLQGCRALRRVG